MTTASSNERESASDEQAPRSVHPRATMIATLAIAGTFVAIVGAAPLIRRLSSHPSSEQCEAMLTRYAEQKARAAILDPAAAASALPPTSPPEPMQVVRCIHDLTAAEVDCALHATYEGELERCLPQH